MHGLLTDVGKVGVRIENFPKPSPGPTDVLIRVKAAGICGSDLPMYRGIKTQDVIDAGQHIIGHEPCGVVESCGDQVNKVKPGDRVVVYHVTGCGTCHYCLQGLYQYCLQKEKFLGLGFHRHGGDAEFVCIEQDYVVLLPPSLSFIDGATSACAGGTAYGALKKVLPLSGNTVVVSGLGPVGLATATVALAMGATVIGLDLVRPRLEIAEKIGCHAVFDVSQKDPVAAIRDLTEGLGATAVIECSGNPRAQMLALDSVAVKGKVILVGHNNQLTINPSYQLIIRKEIGLIGSWIFSCAELNDLLTFMDQNHVSFEPIVTHRLPLMEAETAFSSFGSGQTGKVVFIV